MNDLVKEIGKHVINAITPGGVEKSAQGTTINVSANGTTSVPPKDLKNILFKRFEEMNRSTKTSSSQNTPKAAGAK